MVTLGPKKDGGPNAEFFNAPESLQGFETVRQWLQKNFKKVSEWCRPQEKTAAFDESHLGFAI